MERLTIEINGLKFEVEFDYQPEEAMVMYYSDGSGYPGCPAEIEGIHSFSIKGIDLMPLLDCNPGLEQEVEEAILKAMEEEEKNEYRRDWYNKIEDL